MWCIALCRSLRGYLHLISPCGTAKCSHASVDNKRLQHFCAAPAPLACAGDELQLRHTCAGTSFKPWTGTGTVIKLDDTSEEVILEMKGGSKPPTDTTVDFTVEYLWKSISFDRMQRALKTFAVDETSVSSYLFHRCAWPLASSTSSIHIANVLLSH